VGHAGVSGKAMAELRRLLAAVVERGTGRAAKIGRPACGKTGTSDGFRDVWFAGFTPQMTAVVSRRAPHSPPSNPATTRRGASGTAARMQACLLGSPPDATCVLLPPRSCCPLCAGWLPADVVLCVVARCGWATTTTSQWGAHIQVPITLAISRKGSVLLTARVACCAACLCYCAPLCRVPCVSLLLLLFTVCRTMTHRAAVCSHRRLPCCPALEALHDEGA
jgi:hypothetical protein